MPLRGAANHEACEKDGDGRGHDHAEESGAKASEDHFAKKEVDEEHHAAEGSEAVVGDIG